MFSAGKGPEAPEEKSSVPPTAVQPLSQKKTMMPTFEKAKFSPHDSLAGSMTGAAPKVESSPMSYGGQPMADPKRALEMLKQGA